MKKIFLLSSLLACAVCNSIAQNTPTGDVVPPLPATAPLVSLPSTVTTVSVFNVSRNFIPFRKTTNEFSPMFSLASTGLSRQCKVATTYTNGWGNTIETILRGDAATNDLVTVLDNRVSLTSNKFLSYKSAPNSHFQSSSFADQRNYYNTAQPNEGGYSYSQTETSYPGGVPTVKSYSPGKSFVGRGVGNTVTTGFNTAADNIIMYNVIGEDFANSGVYGTGQLTVTTALNPHSGKVVEYADKDGRVICKQVYSGSDKLTTYYVYNDLGRLTHIIPPEASRLLAISSIADVSKLVTKNVYDDFGNLVKQKNADKDDADYIVYDLKRRPVLTQTPLLRSLNKYKFTLYDNRDRIALTGLVSSTMSYTAWQNAIETTAPTAAPPSSLLFYILNEVSFPYPNPSLASSISGCDINEVNIYDNYVIPGIVFNASYGFTPDPDLDGPMNPYLATNGLVTTSLSRVRDNAMAASSDKWICSVYFYNQGGDVIQVQTLNSSNARGYNNISMTGAAGASWDLLTTAYRFAGGKSKEYLVVNDNTPGSSKPVTTIYNKYIYDYVNNGRKWQIIQTIDGGASVTIADYKYDELGRVSQKSLGGAEMQKYDYSIRGQLTSINRAYATNPCSASGTNTTFGCILAYDYGFSSPRYDGKISGMIWQGASHSMPPRAYGYQYDNAGRLVHAEFRQYSLPLTNTHMCGAYMGETWNKDLLDYTVSNISYDFNGNLLHMKQRGIGTIGTGGVMPVDIDDLTYTYVTGSNRLQGVSDIVGVDYHRGDFQDVSMSCPGGVCPDYAYDADGNLKSDVNKHVSSITYNEMGQPYSIIYDNGNTVNNIYADNGLLVSKTVDVVASSGMPPSHSEYRYLGGMTFVNNQLQFLLHPEGRARYNGATGFFTYDFFVKDHLGNVRTVVTKNITNDPSIPPPVDLDGPPAPHPMMYMATHETQFAQTEEAIFSNIDKVREFKPATQDPNDVMACLLNGDEPDRRVGTSLFLKVMAGDELDISTEAYWDGEPAGEPLSPEDLLEPLLMTLTQPQSGLISGEGLDVETFKDAFRQDGYTAFDELLNSSTNQQAPKAYLAYMFFDEQMNFDATQSGVIQVGSTPGIWEPLVARGVRILKSGHVGILPIIKNAGGTAVFFDPLSVNHYTGVLLQEQHYYPFGLTINEGESGTVVKNKYKYQGKELLDELGYNMYDFTARQYDMQLGRFSSVDPLSQFPSGYTGMGNDPANLVDPSGMAAMGGYVGPQEISAAYSLRAPTGPTGDSKDTRYYIDGAPADAGEYSLTAMVNAQVLRDEEAQGIAKIERDMKSTPGKSSYSAVVNGRIFTYVPNSPTAEISSLESSNSYASYGGPGHGDSFNPEDGDGYGEGGGEKTGKIIVNRKWETAESTTSTFTTEDGSVTGFILEPAGPSTTVPNQDKRIPAGTYNLTPHVKKSVLAEYSLYNDQVAKTRYILIHAGNLPKHTEGCLMPGSSRGTDAVYGSRPVVEALNNYIRSFNGNVIVIINDPIKQ